MTPEENHNPVPERYRAYDLTTTSMVNGSVLVHSSRTQKSIRLSESDTRFLLSCQKFKPLGDHAENYAREIKRYQLSEGNGLKNKLLHLLSNFIEQNGMEMPVGEKEKAPFIRQLSQWAEDGFLVSENELTNEIITVANQNGNAQKEPGKIAAICVPTCNRPETLRRCLNSYIENNRAYGRMVEYIVSDDTSDPDIRKKNRTVLESLAGKTGIRIYYSDRKQRKQYAGLLAGTSGISPEICNYAVLGNGNSRFTGGANRNTLLLQTTGEMSVQVDDDSICRVVLPKDRSVQSQENDDNTLDLSSVYEPYEYWFYEDMEKLSASASSFEQDFTGLHEQLLGRSLSDYMRQYRPNLTMDDLSPEFLNNLNKSNSRIGVTYIGCAGDSGLRESGHLTRLFLEDSSYLRLTETPGGFPVKFTTRYLVRNVDKVTISNSSYCMGLNIGMDQRTQLLPPFIPVGRNEDVVFGQLLRTTCPGIFAGYLPFALIHDPVNKSGRVASTADSIQPPRLNDLIWWLIGSRNLTLINPDPVERFRELGSYLTDVGSMPDADFFELIRSLVCRSYSSQLRKAEQLLSQNQNAIPAWREQMEKYISAVENALAKDDFFRPFDLTTADEKAYKQSKKSIHSLGELLSCWPELVEASKTIDNDEWRACFDMGKNIGKKVND